MVSLARRPVALSAGNHEYLEGIGSDRPKLKVIPAHAVPVGAANRHLAFCIQVINLGAVPLTIREVGVLYSGTEKRGALISQSTGRGKTGLHLD